MARYKKSEEKRKQILYAAFEAVAEHGYDSVTLQTIADHAGVSKGVVHYYFDNKEAVLTDLLDWLTAKIYEKEQAAVSQAQGASQMLEAYLGSVFVSARENRKFYRVYLDFLARASQIPAFREINGRFYRNCASISSAIIAAGQEEGIFERGVKADEAAPAMRALIDGNLIQWLMSDRDDLHAIYRDGCHRAILKLLS